MLKICFKFTYFDFSIIAYDIKYSWLVCTYSLFGEEKLKILCDIHDVMKIRCDFRKYLSCFDHVENDDK